MSRKNKNKRSLAQKSIRTIIILGVFMTLGSCVAAGIQLFRRNEAIYKEMAYAYAFQISVNIDPKDVKKYLEEGKADADYEKTLFYINSTALFSNARYMYVVVPTEEDLIYIWDSISVNAEDERLEDEESAGFLEHVPYSRGEKEAMMRVMRNEWDDSLLIDLHYENREALATALTGIFDEDLNVIAVVGVDISMRGFFESLLRLYLHIFLAFGIVLLVGMTGYYKLIKKHLIAPVVKLQKATVDIFGNLESTESMQVDVHTGDEIDELARSFEEMDRQLKEYIKENASIAAERERISTELDLARRIQADMLPNVFPPFPDRKEFDIFASMNPAKEVGGDFYDFFLIDETHLGLVMADVSGKGIPAALFMMMSKMLLRNSVLSGLGPAEVLETVNDTICENNREEMFITVWIGVLDLESGILRAANAGHEYPVRKRLNGRYELVKDVHGFVIGGMPDMTYREYEMQLVPGTVLFVYTDGLTEATDKNNMLFGTDRMLDALNETAGINPEEIIGSIGRAVDRFTGDAPQFDDLTMMCITYNGKTEE